ncbi:lysis protein [Serratia sp. 1D1416]|uniref:lysis protein n=1 Tax=Serratia sp. 1D1416 TaxID=2447890 RepID=UPI001013CBF1|nr:lysis protein [Serratia sp. 1D1416]
MNWPLPHWQAAIVALVLGLLTYFSLNNIALRHERDKLQSANSQLSGQLDWQNKTQQAVAAIDESRTRELNDAKRKIDDLQRAVDDGSKRLRIAATCKHAATSGVADATAAELTTDARQNYFRLRRQLETTDKQILGLQDYIRDVCLSP